MRFEWDDQKAVENLAKHAVSFGEATEVFYDPNALEGRTLNTQLTKRGLYYWIFNEPNAVRRVCRTARQRNPDHLSTTAHVRRKKVI